MKKVTIIGCGYVGLVTGACLAKMGHLVTCLDIDEQRIESLNRQKVPFYEPGLEELVKSGLSNQTLSFTTSYEQAMRDVEICFLALPTPSNSNGSCDLSYVLEATRKVGENLKGYAVIVNKSTVPIGTSQKVYEILEEFSKDFDVASNPEFLQEGSAIFNFQNPDRILLGVNSKKAKKALEELYKPFADLLQIMDIRSAELSKYAANAMLATRLSFMNHLSLLCEKVGADIDCVRKAIGSDPRIGNHFLFPGVGFGGSCLPKDVSALAAISNEVGLPPDLLNIVLEINKDQKAQFFQKLKSHFGSLSGKTIAILGLSFKPNTDDMREAPSLDIIQMALEAGAAIRVFDPIAKPNLKNCILCKDEYEAASGANAVLLITEWPQFQSIDFIKLGMLMKEKVFFDGRNFIESKKLEEAGFTAHQIGKPKSLETQWI